jgi:hypothetical protein
LGILRVTYIQEGFTTTPIDRGVGIFGVGRSTTAGIFDSWLTPTPNPVYLSGYGNSSSLTAATALQCISGVVQANLPTSSCDPGKMTTMDFIGPNSPHPSETAIKNDYNNFGPAVGFAWQVHGSAKGRHPFAAGINEHSAAPDVTLRR